MYDIDRDTNYLHINQFGGRSQKVWQEFLQRNDFCDVTLSCEDKQIQAHKMIISSNSDMFLNVLRQNTNSHPIIYLRGVKYTDLKNLLLLMYEGEVNIAEDDIASFLNMAEDFKIKGISQMNKGVLSSDEKILFNPKVDNRKEHFNSHIELTLQKINSQEEIIKVEKDYSQFSYAKDFWNREVTEKINMDEITSKCFNLNFKELNDKHITNNSCATDYHLSNERDQIKKENIYSQKELKQKNNTQVDYTDAKDMKASTLENTISYSGMLFMSEKLSENNLFQIEMDQNKKVEQNLNYTEFLGLPEENGKNVNITFDIYNSGNNLEGNEETDIELDNVSHDDNDFEGIEETELVLNDKKYMKIITPNKLMKTELLACKNCEYKTKDKSKLKIHIESIHEGKSFPCNECNFETKSANRLKMHVDNVHIKITHSCEQCEKVYKSKYDLKQHVNTIHLKNSEYPCKHCDHIAINLYFLKKHIAEIHDKCEYLCDFCAKKYTSQRTLRRHKLITHTGVLYYCDRCDFKNSDNGTLKKHIRAIHDGVRYPCVHCEYKAKSKCNLQKHVISIHETGVSYACEKCDYKAPFKSYLKSHIEATHEGIVYPCNQCEFKATRKGSLQSHTKSIHEGFRYLCDQCEYKGTQMSSLIEHKKRRH